MAPAQLWSVERTDMLKRLWGEGWSCSHIAARLGGTTRNAVVGKVWRLGLESRERIQRRPRPLAPPAASDFAARPVTLADLERHHCRWPVGEVGTPEFWFCGGDRTSESSYSAGHHRLAYTPARGADPVAAVQRRRAYRHARAA